jgi:hypothetical protein
MRRAAAPVARRTEHQVGSDIPFFVILAVISATYLVLILAMLAADAAYMMRGDSGAESAWPDAPWVLAWLLDTPIGGALADGDIQYDDRDPLAVGRGAGRLSSLAPPVPG